MRDLKIGKIRKLKPLKEFVLKTPKSFFFFLKMNLKLIPLLTKLKEESTKVMGSIFVFRKQILEKLVKTKQSRQKQQKAKPCSRNGRNFLRLQQLQKRNFGRFIGRVAAAGDFLLHLGDYMHEPMFQGKKINVFF